MMATQQDNQQKLSEINSHLYNLRLKFRDIKQRAQLLIKNLLLKKDRREIDEIRRKSELN